MRLYMQTYSKVIKKKAINEVSNSIMLLHICENLKIDEYDLLKSNTLLLYEEQDSTKVLNAAEKRYLRYLSHINFSRCPEIRHLILVFMNIKKQYLVSNLTKFYLMKTIDQKIINLLEQ